MTKEYPTLYKLTKTGKVQQWKIWVEDTTIWTEYGQKGGKLQTTLFIWMTLKMMKSEKS